MGMWVLLASVSSSLEGCIKMNLLRVQAYCVLHLLCGVQTQSHTLLLGEIGSKGMYHYV